MSQLTINGSITNACLKAEQEVWAMRQKHTFEMAYLIAKQKERRDLTDIKLPDQLFHKVEIKKSKYGAAKILVDDQEVNYVSEVNIHLTPIMPPKVTYIQAKTVAINSKCVSLETEMVNGKKEIAKHVVEMLAMPLVVSI